MYIIKQKIERNIIRKIKYSNFLNLNYRKIIVFTVNGLSIKVLICTTFKSIHVFNTKLRGLTIYELRIRLF